MDTRRIEVDDLFINDLIVFYQVYNNFFRYIFTFLTGDTSKIYIEALFTLKKFGQMPISYMGEKMSIAKSNMTFLIDELTKKGWVERKASAFDRRVINIELTENGSEYLKTTVEELKKILRERLNSLTDEEKQEVITSIRNLNRINERFFKL